MTSLLAFLGGLLAGSFLNVCIYRWPKNESVVLPRSHCPSCRALIRSYDNVPVLSYVWLRGKCRSCSAPISWRYPVVELLNAALWAYVAYLFGPTLLAAKTALFISMMLVLIFADLETYLLPDEVTLGGLAIGLLLSPWIFLEPFLSHFLWWLADATPTAWVASLVDSGLSALLLGGLLYAVGEIYWRIRGIDGLGLGDVKMIAMIAAFWGLRDTILVLILGSLLGALSGLAFIVLAKKEWTHPLPFGSYLGAMAIVVALWGELLLTWYWQTVLPAP